MIRWKLHQRRPRSSWPLRRLRLPAHQCQSRPNWQMNCRLRKLRRYHHWRRFSCPPRCQWRQPRARMLGQMRKLKVRFRRVRKNQMAQVRCRRCRYFWAAMHKLRSCSGLTVGRNRSRVMLWLPRNRRLFMSIQLTRHRPSARLLRRSPRILQQVSALRGICHHLTRPPR